MDGIHINSASNMKRNQYSKKSAETNIRRFVSGFRVRRRVAAWTEWKILYLLCKDKDGLLQKETIRAVYDGGLFVKMEQERASSKKKP